MELTRKTDRFVKYARELSSRGTSFWIVLLGVVLQASHTTLLMYNVSAFESVYLKFIVSLGIGIFISMSLAIFTLKHDGRNKDIENLIKVFFYFEIFTNTFYYWDSIILTKGIDLATQKDWIYLIASLPFAYIMPFAIKKFAGVIKADEKLQYGSIDVQPIEVEHSEPIDTNELKNEILVDVDNKIETQKTEILKEVDDNFIKKGSKINVKSETGKEGSLEIQ